MPAPPPGNTISDLLAQLGRRYGGNLTAIINPRTANGRAEAQIAYRERNGTYTVARTWIIDGHLEEDHHVWNLTHQQAAMHPRIARRLVNPRN